MMLLLRCGVADCLGLMFSVCLCCLVVMFVLGVVWLVVLLTCVDLFLCAFVWLCWGVCV